MFLQKCKKELETLKLESVKTHLPHPVHVNDEKLVELELLLESRDSKIHFLEEEHKKEVMRASEAEETMSSCRYALKFIGSCDIDTHSGRANGLKKVS